MAQPSSESSQPQTQPANSKKTFKLAAVQASPIFHNKAATTAKVCDLIREAGLAGADVIAFPECFIPAYPGWLELIPLTREPARSLHAELFEQAVEVPGPETDAIGEACREAGVIAVVGITERRAGTLGTLYNTALTFGRDGTILLRHQKIVPTVGERLVHAPGTTGGKASLSAAELAPSSGGLGGGGISALICAENGNPLAQYSAGLSYPLVHCAMWPPHWAPGQGMRDATLLITRGIAFSLGCYVINSVAVLDDKAIEAYGIDEEGLNFLKAEQKLSGRATILAPGGAVIAGDSEEEKGAELIYADAAVENVVKAKYGMDYVGHYNRPELYAHHFQGLV